MAKPTGQLLQVNDLVKVKPSYWKQLQISATDRISERTTCNFRVQHNSGTRRVPPQGVMGVVGVGALKGQMIGEFVVIA